MKCFQCGEVGHKKVTCPHGRRGPLERREGRAAPGGLSLRGDGRPVLLRPLRLMILMQRFRPRECRWLRRRLRWRRVVLVDSYLARQEKISEEQVVIGKVLVANPEQGMQCGPAQQAEQIQAELDSSQVSEMDLEEDYESDNVSLADRVSISTDLYSLKEVNEFLDESFGKAVEVAEYFPDIKKFIQTVSTLQKE
ncbi:unnamed protein product, partial [Pleuronectes platessa]